MSVREYQLCHMSRLILLSKTGRPDYYFNLSGFPSLTDSLFRFDCSLLSLSHFNIPPSSSKLALILHLSNHDPFTSYFTYQIDSKCSDTHTHIPRRHKHTHIRTHSCLSLSSLLYCRQRCNQFPFYLFSTSIKQ